MLPSDIIRFPLNTEKGTMFFHPQNKYQFSVALRATATEIKKAIEKLYRVKVVSVNVLNCHGKKRRVRNRLGKRSDWKKAIITLKKGEHIEFG